VYQDPLTFDGITNIDIDDHSYFPVVEKFCYLGSYISRDCKDTEDITHRIKKVGNAFGALRKSIFPSRSITNDVKSTAHKSLILPILLHGAPNLGV